MAARTGISWAHSTWNPHVGCAIVSPGCTNCYAMVRAHEIASQPGKAGAKYAGLTEVVNGRPVWNGKSRIANPDVLDQPRRWASPRLIFVDSMSDLFYEGFTKEEVYRILDMMMEVDRHVYQVLTKRTRRMLDITTDYLADRGLDRFEHIWLGTSVEDQRRAEERVPLIARVKAEVRFLSCEPLLGPLDLSGLPDVEWIIAGGESIDRNRRLAGEHARVFDPDWGRGLRDHCAARGIAFHFKQMGENPLGARPRSPKGEALDDIPEDLRIQEYPDWRPRDLFSVLR